MTGGGYKCDLTVGVTSTVSSHSVRGGSQHTYARHLENKKTLERIRLWFYRPSMFHIVSEYCKSCDVCQKSAGRKLATKAKMIPLPNIDVPLKQIAMDIVGPLDRSESGCHFILVICDYAPRYPEAGYLIALKSTEAEVLAQELMKLFSRVVIPEQILIRRIRAVTSLHSC